MVFIFKVVGVDQEKEEEEIQVEEIREQEAFPDLDGLLPKAIDVECKIIFSS